MKNGRKFTKPFLSATISAALIFAIDLIVPLGVAVGVLYVSCIFLVVREHKKTIFFFAFVCSALTAIVPLITLTPATTWMAFVNRGISILAIWIVAIIASQNKSYPTPHHLYNSLRTLSVKKRLKLKWPVASATIVGRMTNPPSACKPIAMYAFPVPTWRVVCKPSTRLN